MILFISVWLALIAAFLMGLIWNADAYERGFTDGVNSTRY